MHMGDMSKKLKVAIILMIPLLLISPIAGFTILKFPGSEILQLILGTIIFFYSGTPFFSGAKGELNANFPEQSNSSPLRKGPKPAKILYF